MKNCRTEPRMWAAGESWPSSQDNTCYISRHASWPEHRARCEVTVPLWILILPPLPWSLPTCCWCASPPSGLTHWAHDTKLLQEQFRAFHHRYDKKKNCCSMKSVYKLGPLDLLTPPPPIQTKHNWLRCARRNDPRNTNHVECINKPYILQGDESKWETFLHSLPWSVFLAN